MHTKTTFEILCLYGWICTSTPTLRCHRHVAGRPLSLPLLVTILGNSTEFWRNKAFRNTDFMGSVRRLLFKKCFDNWTCFLPADWKNVEAPAELSRTEIAVLNHLFGKCSNLLTEERNWHYDYNTWGVQVLRSPNLFKKLLTTESWKCSHFST